MHYSITARERIEALWPSDSRWYEAVVIKNLEEKSLVSFMEDWSKKEHPWHQIRVKYNYDTMFYSYLLFSYHPIIFLEENRFLFCCNMVMIACLLNYICWNTWEWWKQEGYNYSVIEFVHCHTGKDSQAKIKILDFIIDLICRFIYNNFFSTKSVTRDNQV